jgi:ribosomal protein L12E/L44/L45/RPP1/RPP2
VSLVVPNDPWFLTAVFTVLNMACWVMIALVLKRFLRKLDGKTTASGGISNEKLELDIEAILSEIAGINRKLAEPVAKRDFVVPEPDPLAGVSKEKVELWVQMGLLGADGKGTKEQIENLKKLGLLTVDSKPSEAKPKEKKEKKREAETPKPETNEEKNENQSEPIDNSVMEGLGRAVNERS